MGIAEEEGGLGAPNLGSKQTGVSFVCAGWRLGTQQRRVVNIGALCQVYGQVREQACAESSVQFVMREFRAAKNSLCEPLVPIHSS